MVNYNDMPDFEINKLVAEKEIPTCEGITVSIHPYHPDDGSVEWVITTEDGLQWGGNVNYCNSWSDMGPIIDREKICLEHHSYTWEASLAGYEQSLRRRFVEPQMNDNPLRAAAIAYLMIKEGG